MVSPLNQEFSRFAPAEDALWKQGSEIAKINSSLLKAGAKLTVLHSIEMNLNPPGEGDMSPKAAAR